MADDPKNGQIDKALIRDLAELLDETSLSEIEIEQGGLRVRVARNAGVAVAAPAPAPAPMAAAAPAPASDSGAPASDGPGLVTSPMVGTAYYASSPGAEPYVHVGDKVVKGQTLLIVEAMKTMNQIPSPIAGTVEEVLVSNGQPVEYGEPLIRIA
ncbi:MAG: acetyl-CoA carboxylase biotin carboxyl carrier protein [Pseudomonadota bacterium]